VGDCDVLTFISKANFDCSYNASFQSSQLSCGIAAPWAAAAYKFDQITSMLIYSKLD